MTLTQFEAFIRAMKSAHREVQLVTLGPEGTPSFVGGTLSGGFEEADGVLPRLPLSSGMRTSAD